jgi:predicted metal-dependent peptidase
MEVMAQSWVAQLGRDRGREVLQRSLGGLGTHDGSGVLNHLGEPREKRKPVDWDQILASTIGQRIRREAAFHRPPRRMPDQIGVVPGLVCRPEKPAVMAVIDTSSSMQRPHFERIRYELEKLRTLAEVTVVQCDKAIQRTFALRGPLETIVGRGGTDLRPPLEQKVLDQHRPSLVIYFTDGDGPAAHRAPAVPVVWCLSADPKSGAIKVPAPWGRVVDLR